MNIKKSILFLVITLTVLCTFMGVLSATNVNNNQTIDNIATSDNSVDIDPNIDNAIEKQVVTTEKIDTKSVETNKLSDNEVSVTNDNYVRYFSSSDGKTLNTIETGATIRLSGEFTNRLFSLDKPNLNLVGDGCTLMGGQIIVTDSATGSSVKNIVINTTGYDEAILVEAANVTIDNNDVYITNDGDSKTRGITTKEPNTIISNNIVKVDGPANDINWGFGDDAGLATTMGILSLYGVNTTIANNTVTVSNSTVPTNYSTIDGIELKGSTYNTVYNNTVNIGGARFVYALNALSDVFNNNFTNNKLLVEGYRYVAGVQIGNNAKYNKLSDNVINASCINSTVFTGDDEALAFGIITTSMGGTSSSHYEISNNSINISASAAYGMEIYETSNTTISGNNINVYNLYSMGMGIAHSPNLTISNNEIYTVGDSSTIINAFAEEIKAANKGIQVQQDSDNIVIIGNTIVAYDANNNSTAICIDKIDNATISSNSVAANDKNATDSIVYEDSNVTITNNTSPHDNKNAIITIAVPTGALFGSNITVNATITDSEDTTLLLNGTAVLKINGISLNTLTVTNGVVSFQQNLTQYQAGTHNVSVVFSTSGYNRAENYTDMEVSQSDINISSFNGTSFSGYPDEVFVINQTLVDTNGNALVGNIYVAIKVNGITVKTLVVKDGEFVTNFTIPKVGEGISNITIKIGYNGKYNNFSVNSTLNLSKQDVVVALENITATPGSTITFRATLTNAITRTPVARGYYVFKINGLTVLDENGERTVKQISNGVAEWDYEIPNEFKDGVYNITLVFSGSCLNNELRYSDDALTIEA